MALVGETSLLRDPGKRLIGPAHQRLGALKPTSHDIALGTNPERLSEKGRSSKRPATIIPNNASPVRNGTDSRVRRLLIASIV